MKLLTYEIDKKELVGVLNREETFVYPLSAADMDYRTMKDVISEISGDGVTGAYLRAAAL